MLPRAYLGPRPSRPSKRNRRRAPRPRSDLPSMVDSPRHNARGRRQRLRTNSPMGPRRFTRAQIQWEARLSRPRHRTDNPSSQVCKLAFWSRISSACKLQPLPLHTLASVEVVPGIQTRNSALRCSNSPVPARNLGKRLSLQVLRPPLHRLQLLDPALPAQFRLPLLKARRRSRNSSRFQITWLRRLYSIRVILPLPMTPGQEAPRMANRPSHTRHRFYILRAPRRHPHCQKDGSPISTRTLGSTTISILPLRLRSGSSPRVQIRSTTR